MRHSLLFATAFIALAGCTAGPDYTGPAAEAPPPPDRFVRATDTTVPQAASAPWWMALGDPLLDQLVTRALAGNPDLNAAAARIRQARASLRERRASDLPAVNSSAIFAKARLPGQESDGGATNLTLYNLGFDSSWELDLFGGRRRSLEVSRAQVGAREASLADARVSLSAEVAQTYVDLRLSQDRLARGEQSLALQEQQIALARQRFTAGTVGRAVLLQAERDRDDARAQLAPVRAQVDADKDRLAILTGSLPGSLDPQLDATGAIPLPPAQVAVGDPATLLRRRPDIRVAERTLAAQTAQVGVAEAARFPRISFLGLIGLGGAKPANLFNFDDLTIAAVPRLSWSLLDFGAARSRVQGAQAQRDEAAAQYRKAVLNALADAEASLSRFGQSREALAERARAERQATAMAELARQRRQAGTIAGGDQLTAQQVALAATDARQQAAADTTNAFIAIQKALGLGWQDTEAGKTSE